MAPDWTEIRASLLGGLLGGIVLGLVLQYTTPLLLAMTELYFVDKPTLATGWVATIFVALTFGVVFASIVTRYVDDYISTVLMLTTRSEAAKNAIVPLTDRFGMALVVTSAMGLIYGLTVGIGIGWFLVPSLTPLALVPFLDGSTLLGFALFGLALGGTYGELVMG